MRRRRPASPARALSLALVAGGATAFACGNDDRQQTPTELYPSRYASAVCAEWESCCRANGITFDRGKCELSGAIFIQGGVDRANAAGATLDPNKADDCIVAAVAATKKCVTIQDDPAARVACGSVWSGPKKVGDACTGDLECETTDKGVGACLKTAGANEAGVCVTKTSTAQVGDVCGKTPDGAVPKTIADCDGNDLQCSILSGTCSELVAIGGKCGTFNRCVKGAFCSTDVCVEGLAAGEACSESEPSACSSGVCIHGKCGDNGVGTLVACTGEM